MVKFGPSGNSPSFFNDGNKSSLEAPKWLKKQGLELFEYSFGRGYTMSQSTAEQLGLNARENNIEISLHAPYYINLANENPEMIEKSFNYILDGLKYLKLVQGKKLVVHIASQGKLSREVAFDLTKKNLQELLKRVYQSGYSNFYICPETMGKILQIGTYQEIVNICMMDKMLIPTFDFGHINCLMQGGLNSLEAYSKIFDYAIAKLGFEKVNNCHIHFSKIEFGSKGEIRHLNYDATNFGPDFQFLAQAIKKYNLNPTIICESKDFMAEDALIFKTIFNQT